MKTNYIEYSTLKELQKEIQKVKKIEHKSLLIQVYTGILDEKILQPILNTLLKELPHGVVIGASTAGEIHNAKVSENKIIIGFSTFRKTKLKAAYVPKTDAKHAKKLIKKIDHKNIKAAILLSNGLCGEHQPFLEEFNNYKKDLIVSGGLAGDNFKLQKTFIILQDKFYHEGSLAVSFSSKKLFADNQYTLSWYPIGKEFTITKAKGATVYEIDNIPAATFYEKYLGKSVFEKLPNSLLEFQLLFQDGNTTVARTPMARDGDTLIFAAPIQEGQQVQFGFSNAQTLLSNATNLKHEIAKQPAQTIFIFSCIARKALLGEYLEDEISRFESLAPTIGFLTYGEYYKTDQNNALLNCTTTMLILSESTKVKKKHQELKEHSQFKLGENTFESLLYFISQTTNELQEQMTLLDQYKKAIDESLLISKTDKKGIITYVNDNFVKVSGYSKEELIGAKHNIIKHPKDQSKIFKDLWKTISSGKIWRGVVENLSKNGKSYYVDATILPLFDKQHNIIEYMALRQDITKQIKHQKKIKSSESILQAIFDNQESVVIFTSIHDGIININRRFFELFDFTDMKDFKQKYNCICELFIEEDGYIYPTSKVNWLDFVSKRPKEKHKVKMRDKFGKVRTFSLKVNAFDDKAVISLDDITELEEALLKAHFSEHAKSMFVANMSHEIRTPLNGILGFTDILLQSDNLGEKEKHYLNIISKSGETLLGIVNDILDMSKIESGQMDLDLHNVELSSEIESIASIFAAKAKEKQIEYNVFIDPQISKTIKCDSQRLKQVLSNLIGNAIKFTPQNGEVNVEIKVKEKKENQLLLYFEVNDNGIGIKEENLSSIFNSFTQADNSISREFGGTGLGLPISAKFVEMMNGKLHVESKEQQGSKFFFELWFDIVDDAQYINAKNQFENLNVCLYEPEESNVYNILKAYLDSWDITYVISTKFQKDSTQYDLIFTYNKFLSQNCIKDISKKQPNAKVFCITSNQKKSFEGMQKYPNFHIIEQPLIASDLYNELVSIFSEESYDFYTHKENQAPHFKAKILIAEDNTVNQLLIGALLDEREIAYSIAKNGEKAYEMATQEDFDLILMDINMPVKDGLSATKELRANNYTKPIIALTANVIESDKMLYNASGMDDYLAKPIDIKELNRVLIQYLGNNTNYSEDETLYDEINLETLMEAIELYDKDTVHKLLEQFSLSVDTITPMLIQEMELSSAQELAKTIHQIKGMVSGLHFDRTYKNAIEIERVLKRDNRISQEVTQKCDLLIEQLSHLRAQADKLLN